MRVAFDDRAGLSGGTGIPRYAQELSLLLSSGALDSNDVVLLNHLAGCNNPAEDELALPALIEREEIDVYHSPLFTLPAVLPARTRAIVTVHDAIPAVRPDLTDARFAAFFAREARDAAHRASVVVCPSEHAGREVTEALGLPPEQVRVLPEAPAACFAPADEALVFDVCRRHGLEPGRYLLGVGSIERRKGPDLTLEAVSRLLPSAPWLRCVFAGPPAGYDLDGAVARIGLQGAVVAPGRVPDEDLAALYTGALALVFPSRHEGFGLPVVEAFACGTPVVASDATSIPEVAGDAALLVPPADPAALAGAIRRLIDESELGHELRRRGTARLAERFTRDHVRAAFAALYAELAQEVAA